MSAWTSKGVQHEQLQSCTVFPGVSTNHGQDPELQLRELREYAASRGWSIVREYTDLGVSGSKDSRPALNELMADARRRRFDAILVWKLDRFGRSLRHLVNALAEVESDSIAFVSLRDNLDLTTPTGRLMFHVIAAMAEFERALTVERVRAGLQHARSKGIRLGRPRSYVNADHILSLRDAGLSWRSIAKKLGVGVGTVHRAAQAASKNVPKVESEDDLTESEDFRLPVSAEVHV